MQPPVASQLGVKAEREDAALAHRHGAAFVRGNDFRAARRLQQWRPDEHARKGLAAQARDLEVAGLGGKTFPGVFIRSPLLESTGSAEIVATHEGRAVAVRQGSILALCFHPELTSDRRLHQELVRMAGVGHP